jgi:hypothetical protein
MIKVTPNIRSIVDRDGAVILDIGRNTMTTVDATGAYVWQRLELGMTIDAVITELARDTNTDEAVVAQDVEAFVDQLKDRHLLHSADDAICPRER